MSKVADEPPESEIFSELVCSLFILFGEIFALNDVITRTPFIFDTSDNNRNTLTLFINVESSRASMNREI
jgi:hypothetical protein